MSFKNKDEGVNPFTFFKPTQLSWFSNLANIYAWLNLIVAILYIIFSLVTLNQQIARNTTDDLFLMDGASYLTTSNILSTLFPIIITFVSTLGNFILFKSISIGLNILLEIGFTITADEKEGENE